MIFFHRGVKTLQKLVEEIEQSTVVLHMIGDPADQANALTELVQSIANLDRDVISV